MRSTKRRSTYQQSTRQLAAIFASVALLAAAASPVSAACTRLGFTVNDYGKDGPTKDAKDLLDKHIVKKMAERGIAKYSTGTKSVTCELFLNFIVFDEHTCTAEATVCWDGTPMPKGETVAADAAAAKPVADKKAAAEKKSVPKADTSKAEDTSHREPARSEAIKSEPKAETAKVVEPATPIETSSTTKEEPKAVEPAKAEAAPKPAAP